MNISRGLFSGRR